MNEFNVNLRNFDGPFSVLLHLIEIHDIDLYDIEISMLTDQFLEYIDENASSIDDISDFLVMASRLLEIKSAMLLPKNNDFDDDIIYLEDEDPRLWLVESLIEYKKFRDLTQSLQPMYEAYSGRWSNDKPYFDNKKRSSLLDNEVSIDVNLLSNMFTEILLRMPTKDKERAKYFETLSFNKYNVESFRESIYNKLRDVKSLSFFDYISQGDDLEYAITSFLAILELMKYGHIDAKQDFINDDIIIILAKESDD